jgi:hypothetical protein
VRASASDDLSAAVLVATVVTVRVDIADAMLARAKRVVLLVVLLLNCENGPSFGRIIPIFTMKC